MECSIIYYPGQNVINGVPTGHTDLRLGDTVYTVGCGLQTECPFNQRMEHAQNGGLPFEEYSLQLTREQGEELKKILSIKASNGGHIAKNMLAHFATIKKIFAYVVGENKMGFIERGRENHNFQNGITCMACVSNALEKAGIISIPPGIKISPLLGSLYLRALHSSDNKTVTKITKYGSCFSSIKNAVFTTTCKMGEATAVALAILVSAYPLLHVLKTNMTTLPLQQGLIWLGLRPLCKL